MTAFELENNEPPWHDALERLTGATSRRRMIIIGTVISLVAFVALMVFVGVTAPVVKAASAGYPGCTDCKPPMTYTQQSAVMGGSQGDQGPGFVTVTPVYWTPPGTSFDPTYRSVINGFVANVAKASGSRSNVFSILTQYTQNLGGAGPVHLKYDISAGRELSSSAPIPSAGGCTPGSGETSCVTDSQLQSTLLATVRQAGQPIDDAHLYVVLLPSGVQSCDGSGHESKDNECSNGDYCATHSALQVGSSWLVYATMPYADPNGCSDPSNGAQSPNGNSYADTEVNTMSHEIMESITDYAGAWSDVNGNEIGDICSDVYAPSIGATNVASDNVSNGTMYNQQIGSGRYYIQDEFSNLSFSKGRGDQAIPDNATTMTTIKGCIGHLN